MAPRLPGQVPLGTRRRLPARHRHLAQDHLPPSWDAEKINALVLDVARNPDDVPEQDRNGGWITRGTRENIRIEVRLRPDGPIVTGYPVSGLGVHRNDPDGNPTEQQW